MRECLHQEAGCCGERVALMAQLLHRCATVSESISSLNALMGDNATPQIVHTKHVMDMAVDSLGLILSKTQPCCSSWSSVKPLSVLMKHFEFYEKLYSTPFFVIDWVDNDMINVGLLDQLDEWEDKMNLRVLVERPVMLGQLFHAFVRVKDALEGLLLTKRHDCHSFLMISKEIKDFNRIRPGRFAIQNGRSEPIVDVDFAAHQLSQRLRAERGGKVPLSEEKTLCSDLHARLVTMPS